MSWLTVCGKNSPDLARTLEERVAARKTQGEFADANVRYIEKLSFAPVAGRLEVSDETLERLRKLCQLWDVDLKVLGISSHRKIVGPLIVGVKKMLFPVLRIFLKEFIKQQRAFNAEVISFLACMEDRTRP